MFKFSLGSFGTFPIFADLVHVVSRKRLTVEQNGPNFGPLGEIFSVHRVILTVQVQFGVIRFISDFPRPCTSCISETANRRAKWTKFWTSGVKSLVYIGYLFLLSVQVQFGVIQCISDFHRPCAYFILEMANCRAKWTKLWASGVST